MGLSENKKQQLRSTILDAALFLLKKHGYGAVTVQKVAELSNISSRTIFRYFETKDDMIVEWVRVGMGRLLDVLRGRPQCEPLAQQLIISARAMLCFYEDHGETFLAVERAISASPTMAARKQCLIDELAAQVTVTVSQEGNQDLSSELAQYLYPNVIFSLIRTVVRVWVNENGERPLTQIFDEATAMVRLID